MSDQKEKKRELRRAIREQLKALTNEEMVAAKMGLFERLWHSRLFRDDDRLLGYYPAGREADLRYFYRVWLSHRRELALPRVAEDLITMELWRLSDILAVVPGYKGIMEPNHEYCEQIPPEEIDAALIPGLAFDSAGARLGQGGGHYDRLLPRLSPDCIRIGVCHEFQLLPPATIPLEQHDIAMHYVVTPHRLLQVESTR